MTVRNKPQQISIGDSPTGTAYIEISDGIWYWKVRAKDNDGDWSSYSIYWVVKIDTIPPITSIYPNETVVKIGTNFTFSAIDDDCGVNYTQYSIDGNDWVNYSSLSIDSYGYHNITYRSVDNLGNVESNKTLQIYVPKEPITTLNVGIPQYGTTPRFVNFSTQFSFSVLDDSGTGIRATNYRIDLDGSWVNYTATGPFTIPMEGEYTIYYYSTDNMDNIEDTREFDIIVDNTPPITTIDVGEPKYILGDTWVTSATEFTLDATDDGLIPVGINYTEYRVWNNGSWTSWEPYSSGFTLDVEDGITYVGFHSIDKLGNTEPVQNRTYIVDNAPPTTVISVGEPKYRSSPNDIWNITSGTTFALPAIDNGTIPVGLNYTEYRIWSNGSWSECYKYTDGFTLGLENGIRYVIWHSVDYLGNREITHNETYFVDNIPPVTDYILQLEADDTEARISLFANDVGSGVNLTKYRVGSKGWLTYSNTFVINESGWHTIYFLSIDNLGNVEQEKNFSVLVKAPDTTTPPGEEPEEMNYKPLIALIFAIVLLILGIWVSYKHPIIFKGILRKDRLYTFFIGVLPFVIGEAATGVVSLFTGLLSVPPLLGIGMIVDLAILIAGLISCIAIFKKGGSAMLEGEEAQTMGSTRILPPPPPSPTKRVLPPPPPPRNR